MPRARLCRVWNRARAEMRRSDVTGRLQLRAPSGWTPHWELFRFQLPTLLLMSPSFALIEQIASRTAARGHQDLFDQAAIRFASSPRSARHG